jgi:hypothetical protein
MAVTLRSIYEGLSGCSTANHIGMCDDFLKRINASENDNLAQLFADAFVSNRNFNQVEQSFVDENLLRDRKPLSKASKGTNRVAYAMSEAGKIDVKTSPSYEFQYLEREVPHLRTEKSNEHKDKGWIDYIAASNTTPILGEIKYDSDQNPFYAFVQILTYLSEMATPHQITRAVRHRLFGDSIDTIISFDLHIFLANFNDRGEKGRLIEPTRQLAVAFKERLQHDNPEAADCVGKILCIAGEIEKSTSTFSDVKLLWVA